jgi:hypothetical protein
MKRRLRLASSSEDVLYCHKSLDHNVLYSGHYVTDLKKRVIRLGSSKLFDMGDFILTLEDGRETVAPWWMLAIESKK